MAVQTTKASEVTDLTQDPIDSDKILGYNANTGAGMFSLSRLFNWIKTKTASVITPGDKTPVNADAVNGALANVEWTVRTNINNDEELFWWLINHPYKQALLYLQYDSEFLGCTAGEFVIYGSRDAGIVKGQFTETYGRQTVFFIEINLNAHELRTKDQLATKSDLTNYAKCENVVDYNAQYVYVNCNDYLNKNYEYFGSGWQFDNIPIPEGMSKTDILMVYFISRGENLFHNGADSGYRNIQEISITYFKSGIGWVTSKFRRFAIDSTIFPWNMVY